MERWIKVDSAITRGISRDRRRRAVLKMLARVARDFAVELVAEGIETAEDLDVCFQERVFAAQGHFLALPQEAAAPPSPELTEWLAARRPVPEPLAAEPAVTPEQMERAEVAFLPEEPAESSEPSEPAQRGPEESADSDSG
jgi:predicted signal transduction protein with EAL and GGDEF domain